jgi:hypothetical protein
MGHEATCTLRVGRRQTGGKALLESDHLLFRGPDTRVRISFSDIRSVDARDGVLYVVHAGGTTALDLGATAVPWAEKIRNPRSLLDKLGVKQGMRVAVIGLDDGEFMSQLAARTSDVTTGRARAATDLVFYGAESKTALANLERLKASIKPDGAIWVVHRKGKDSALKDVDVFAAARSAGLVDNKVAAFSSTHTAEKLVIPLKERG